MSQIVNIIEFIVFWYPVTMGILWIIGSILYYFRIERKTPLPLINEPLVSILVPAYNEEATIETTITKLLGLNYSNYEIIIINDGSNDNSAYNETALAEKYKIVRFINLKENCGKANALYLGLIAARGEYLVCVDGDSYLDKDCLRYMIPHFITPHNGERVGAVTGNPRVRNRSTLLAKLQLCEYASIISLIKRTQRMWGKVMSVSGVVVAFRKRALLDCGLWDRDLITEDIAVTWKLERNFWDVRYEPNAICWMLVPETIKGLCKQRKRWAQGGQEVLLRHFNIIKSWSSRRLLPILFEQLMSILWIILWLILTIVEIYYFASDMDNYISYIWKSQFLSFICIFQFLIAFILEHKYDKKMFRHFIVAAWYPLVYWVVNGFMSLLAIPDTIRNRNQKLATWKSPDRGLTSTPKANATKSKDAPDSEATELMVVPDPNQNTITKKTAWDLMQPIPITPLPEPKYIQKPELPEEIEPEIIDGKQKPWKKVIEILITIFAWSFILVYLIYVIYGFITLAKGQQPFEFWIYNTNVLMETIQLLKYVGIIFIVEFVFLVYWKYYNRFRYAKLTRRHFKPDVSLQELSDYFEINPGLLMRYRVDNIIELENNIFPTDYKTKHADLKKMRR